MGEKCVYLLEKTKKPDRGRKDLKFIFQSGEMDWNSKALGSRERGKRNAGVSQREKKEWGKETLSFWPKEGKGTYLETAL